MNTNERLERIEERQDDCRIELAKQGIILEEIHTCMKPAEGPSYPVRLDRVERFQKGIIKTIWAVLLTGLAAAGAAVVAVFKG
jgi:hypothetical protein